MQDTSNLEGSQQQLAWLEQFFVMNGAMSLCMQKALHTSL